MDAEKIQRLKEELIALHKWQEVPDTEDDPVGRQARLRRFWEIVVELGKASEKPIQR